MSKYNITNTHLFCSKLLFHDKFAALRFFIKIIIEKKNNYSTYVILDLLRYIYIFVLLR